MTPLTAYTLGVATPFGVIAAWIGLAHLHPVEAWGQWTLHGFRCAWVATARTTGGAIADEAVREVFPRQWADSVAALRRETRRLKRLPLPWMLHPLVWAWTLRAFLRGRS